MFRVTADTNVYIAGLMTAGINRRFLELTRAGYLGLGISGAILDEIQDVLERKFLSEKDALEARAYVESITRRVHPKRHIKAVGDDPDDDAILECAIEHVSDFVISADKHLLKMVRFEEVPIMPVQQFMERAFGVRSRS